MFKKNFRLAVLMLSLIIIVAGCGEQSSGSKDEDSADSGDTLNTTIVGGSSGGVWSTFTEGVAESIRREYEGSIVTAEPGSIKGNPQTVGNGEIPFGLDYAMTAYMAYQGEEAYEQSYKDLRAAAVVIPNNYYQFVARADAEYDSFQEIVDNQIPMKLAVDDQGSPSDIVTRAILDAYGVTFDDLKSWGGSVDYLSGSKIFELMADRRVESTGDVLPIPSNDILQASASIDLKMFSLKDEVIDTVTEELGMVPGTVEAGSYDFLNEDIQTVNTPVILMTNKNVSEDKVYKVVSAIYNNIDYLGTVQKEFKNLNDETIVQVGGLPLHPGAEKFFKEKGLID